MARILIVEDELPLARSLQMGLRDEQHAVDVETDGDAGLWAARGGEYDVVVLDRMLPGLDGLEVCRALRREEVATPILMLTALAATGDVVSGLDAGANDYLTKPFAFDELLARIRALLRDSRQTVALTLGPLQLDMRTHRAELDARPLSLSTRELQLLDALMRRPGQVLTRDRLTATLWERDCEPDSNSLEVYVSRLRSKLDPGYPGSWIRTVRGVGYALQEPRP